MNILLKAIKDIELYYPQINAYLQESGNVILEGNGEFVLNLALKDICNDFFSHTLIVSFPFIPLRETVISSTSMKCVSNSSKNPINISLIAVSIINNDSITSSGKFFFLLKNNKNIIEDLIKKKLYFHRKKMD